MITGRGKGGLLEGEKGEVGGHVQRHNGRKGFCREEFALHLHGDLHSASVSTEKRGVHKALEVGLIPISIMYGSYVALHQRINRIY